MSWSIVMRERTGVAESGGVERAAEPGTSGAGQPCSPQQNSDLPAAARRPLQR
ncbi:hypothetical protein [Nocardia asteroides]